MNLNEHPLLWQSYLLHRAVDTELPPHEEATALVIALGDWERRLYAHLQTEGLTRKGASAVSPPLPELSEQIARIRACCGSLIATKTERVIREALAAVRRQTLDCHTEGAPVVWLPFSAYELVNVAAALLTAEAGPGTTRSPLDALQTGDWTNVVAWRFRDAAQQFAPQAKPNRTTEQLREDARALASRPQETTPCE